MSVQKLKSWLGCLLLALGVTFALAPSALAADKWYEEAAKN